VGKQEAADAQVLADATQEQLEKMASDEPLAMEQSEHEELPAGDEEEDPLTQPPPPPPAEESEEREATATAKRRGGRAVTEQNEASVEEDAATAEGATAPWEAGAAERQAGESEQDAARIGPVGGHAGTDERGEPDADAAPEAEEEAQSIEALRDQFEAEMSAWQLDGERAGASEAIWRRFESLTSGLAQELCEQLRLILEATVASKLQGDYRTGKRISMRKVIPYIASGFRKDKIWLRRTKPSKRQYQVMLCIDDSESMRHTGAGGLACEALALITGALTRLEVGQLSVLSFAERVEILHPFDRPFTAESGAHMMSRFTFSQRHTHMEALLETVVRTLHLAREQQSGGSADQLQLVIIVSDGRRSPSWGDPHAWVRRATEQHILLCFVIIDAAAAKDSIIELQSVTYPNGRLTISKWIDAFPFPYYIVLRNLHALPQVLSDALRQWFEFSTKR